ncbi:beta-ketoacyl-ACP synthase III [Thermosediminibacter litoriperuensis]|uniref:Beta-ketoacyl-[acyl-carrier-protein] synthase III n=1 Tax=Thermosediminibacter litoriperuensis TaxID=291989 RepID=A0A5S5B1M6_9FIRM|nr:beta-ketoacyl-ACP synthase III [Thermosediminibacter litoriperuensis]TYP59973.1 3-oxoacyl-[acyl-carrier-protein] synthase-3 [Thermosediminibacter litoriperuensis]
MKRAGIIGVGSYTPEKVLTNNDLEKMVETSDEWIKARTGISYRRIAGENTATSDMAVKASFHALQRAGLDPGELDLIIGATVTPDMMFPSTACVVQRRIGAFKAAAFDLSAGCTGFIYALTTAAQFIASGMYRNILIFGAETLSKIVDWQDRNTCVLFGDGAGAAVISEVEQGGILESLLGADGGGKDLLFMPAGGSREPASIETVRARKHYIKMNGNEVFKFAVKIMEESTRKVVEKANLTMNDVALVIPHQANMRIIDAAVKRLDIPKEKVMVNLDRYGNMSAASIPVALDEAVREKRIKKGDKVVLVGFGAGLTWGANLIEWSLN